MLKKSQRVIINENAISCFKCVFLKIEDSSRLEKDHLFRCIKQVEKNLANGKIEFPMTVSCRKDETICGIKAKNYVEKTTCKYCSSAKIEDLNVSCLGK